RLELQSFMQAARGEHEVEVDGEAGLRALHLALAVVTSATESRVVTGAELGALWDSRSLGAGRGVSAPGGAHRDDL
ncbi:MAG: hypothetical protein QOI23_2746, partial [Chloroflexota bacterium]|nr:hypothetical protein [Chloroflexota bacterium]